MEISHPPASHHANSPANQKTHVPSVPSCTLPQNTVLRSLCPHACTVAAVRLCVCVCMCVCVCDVQTLTQ